MNLDFMLGRVSVILAHCEFEAHANAVLKVLC